MARQSELEETFQDARIHARWESVYRNSRLQDRLNDRMMDRVVRWLKLPPLGRVLDAGCGVGDHTFRLARRGFCCVGADISECVLETAQRRAAELGLSSQVSFVRCGLEDLSSIEGTFDGIHCRGVLMHIPRFQDAVRELCRLLRPGGRIVIMENNRRSLETLLVRTIRLLRKSRSEMVATEGGLEFWCPQEGEMPLWRIADVRALRRELSRHQVRCLRTRATEFWDINRFPAGVPRNLAVLLNLAYFSLRLPAFLSMGNAIVGEKEEKGANGGARW
jgi:ubiquinone/menaquinone biosynthesis C-methylase UbiE